MQVVTRGRPTATRRKAAPAKRAQPARQAATAKKPAARTAKAPAKASHAQATYDVSKPPTDYHKKFARWIMDECGFDPESKKSKTIAFLMGVSIATASRPIFMKSDFLAEWREETGQAKRGPKTSAEKSRRSKREVVSDDEFEDESEEFDEDENEFEDSEEDTEDDEFDDESESDDEDEFDDESDEDDEDDEFEDEEEEEPEPPKRGRAANTRKGAATRGANSRSRTSAPSKKPATRGRAKAKPADDDDFVF